jgi:hypothetical protein
VLRAVEDAVAALIEAGAAEAVEHRPHTPTARARTMSNPLSLPLNRLPGVQPLSAKSNRLATPGALRQPIQHLPPKSHRVLFQTVSRRAGQVCSLHLRQYQRRWWPQLRSKCAAYTLVSPFNVSCRPIPAAKPKEVAQPPTLQPEPSVPEFATVEAAESPAIDTSTLANPEISIPPAKDELTVDNLEQIPVEPHDVPTATAASTTASSWDNRTTAGSTTPYSSLQGQPQAVRPQLPSGFQTSALKAAGPAGRTASYQRRVLDQEEAVRMPGNREVDRAAVQFGAFNLNGTGEDDVDGDREEPETRAQPPQHSPVAHPRAALPPAPQQAAATSETIPTPKQAAGVLTNAPGLPSPQSLPGTQSSQQAPPANAQFGQYGRYGPGGESTLPPKPYEGFNQQAPSTQGPFEGYQQAQSQPQAQTGAFSSAPNEFSSYYTADPQQRNAYSYYQQQYGQQGAQGQQEGSTPQQRSYSGYGGPQAEGAAQFPQSAAQQPQSRYATAGEGQNSGHTTPNPVAQPQQPGAAPAAQTQPGHPQQPQAASYPYGHPYYSSPYYASYLNQYQQYGGGSYPGGPYPGKGGLHAGGYPGYGMSPAAPYEHASSPAAGGFGSSLHGRDSALAGGLGDFGRAGSAQASQAPQGLGSGAFGGSQDTFGPGSTYQGRGYAQQGAQPAAGGDDLKPFGDSKNANGRSPSLSQPGRPGSATNTTPGSSLPPAQSQQAGYGGYPSHLQGHGLHGAQAGSQYGGLGAGAHQAAGQGHQTSQYGGYQSFGGNFYGNSQHRGGWGGNYGH